MDLNGKCCAMDMDTDLDELNDRFDINSHTLSLSIYISIYVCVSVCVCYGHGH